MSGEYTELRPWKTAFREPTVGLRFAHPVLVE